MPAARLHADLLGANDVYTSRSLVISSPRAGLHFIFARIASTPDCLKIFLSRMQRDSSFNARLREYYRALAANNEECAMRAAAASKHTQSPTDAML